MRLKIIAALLALSPSGPALAASSDIDALTACQIAIARTAKFKVVKKPGYVRNMGEGDEFYFAWPKGEIVFQNGFGAEVKTSASCIGSLARCEINYLTVNGEDVNDAPLRYPCKA